MKKLVLIVTAIWLGSTLSVAKSMIEMDCNMSGGKSHSLKVVSKTGSATNATKLKMAPKTKGQ